MDLTPPGQPAEGHIYFNDPTGETITVYKDTNTAVSKKPGGETVAFATLEGLISYLYTQAATEKPAPLTSANALSETEMGIIEDLAENYGLIAKVDYIGPKATGNPYMVILSKSGQREFTIRKLANRFHIYKIVYKPNVVKGDPEGVLNTADWQQVVKTMHVQFAHFAQPTMTTPDKDINKLSLSEMQAIDKLAKKYMLGTKQSVLPPNSQFVPYISIQSNMGSNVWAVRRTNGKYQILNIISDKNWEIIEEEQTFSEMLIKLMGLFEKYMKEPQAPEKMGPFEFSPQESSDISNLASQFGLLIKGATMTLEPDKHQVAGIEIIKPDGKTLFHLHKDNNTYRIFKVFDSGAGKTWDNWYEGENSNAFFQQLTLYLGGHTPGQNPPEHNGITPEENEKIKEIVDGYGDMFWTEYVQASPGQTAYVEVFQKPETGDPASVAFSIGALGNYYQINGPDNKPIGNVSAFNGIIARLHDMLSELAAGPKLDPKDLDEIVNLAQKYGFDYDAPEGDEPYTFVDDDNVIEVEANGAVRYTFKGVFGPIYTKSTKQFINWFKSTYATGKVPETAEQFANNILQVLNSGGFLDKNKFEVPAHKKIYAIKAFRTYIMQVTGGPCALKKSKWAIENLGPFLDNLKINGLPNMDDTEDFMPSFKSEPHQVSVPDKLLEEEQVEIDKIVKKYGNAFTTQLTPSDAIVIWVGQHITSYKVAKETDVYRLYTDKDGEWVIQNQFSTINELLPYLDELLAHISKALANTKLDLPHKKTTPSTNPEMLSGSELTELKKLIKKFGLAMATSYTKKLMEASEPQKDAYSLTISDPDHNVWIKITKSQGLYVFSKGLQDAYFPLKKFALFHDLMNYTDYFFNSYIKEPEQTPIEKISDEEVSVLKDLVKKYKVNAKVRRKYMTAKGAGKVPYVFIELDDPGMKDYALAKTAKGAYKLYEVDSLFEDWKNVAITDGWDGMYDIIHKVMTGEPIPDASTASFPPVLNPDQLEWLETLMKTKKPGVLVKKWGNGVVGGYDSAVKINGELNPLFVIRFAEGSTDKRILQVQTEDGGMAADEYPFNTFEGLAHFMVTNLEVVTQLLKGEVAPESKLAELITKAGYKFINQTKIDIGTGSKDANVYDNGPGERIYLFSDGSSRVWYMEKSIGDKIKKEFKTIPELVDWMQSHYEGKESDETGVTNELKEMFEYLAYLGFTKDASKSDKWETRWQKQVGPDHQKSWDIVMVESEGTAKVKPSPLIGDPQHGSVLYFNTMAALKQYLTEKFTKGNAWHEDYLDKVLTSGKFQKVADEDGTEMGFKWVTNKMMVIPFPSGGIMETPDGVDPHVRFTFESTYDLAKRLELYVAGDVDYQDPGWATGYEELDELIDKAGFIYQGHEETQEGQKLVFLDAGGIKLVYYTGDETASLMFPPSPSGQQGINFPSVEELIDHLKQYVKHPETPETDTFAKNVGYAGLLKTLDKYGFELTGIKNAPDEQPYKIFKRSDGAGVTIWDTGVCSYKAASDKAEWEYSKNFVELDDKLKKLYDKKEEDQKGPMYYPDNELVKLIKEKGFTPEMLVYGTSWVHPSKFHFELHEKAIVWHAEKSTKEFGIEKKDHFEFLKKALAGATPSDGDDVLDMYFSKASVSRQEKLLEKAIDIATGLEGDKMVGSEIDKALHNRGFEWYDEERCWVNNDLYQVVMVNPKESAQSEFRYWWIEGKEIHSGSAATEQELLMLVGPGGKFAEAQKWHTNEQTGAKYDPSGETYKVHDVEGNAELIWLNKHDQDLLNLMGFVPVPQHNRFYKNSSGNIVKFRDTGKAEYIDYFGHPDKPENAEVIEFESIPHALKFMVAKHSPAPFSQHKYKSDDGEHIYEIPLNQHDHDVLASLGFEWNEKSQKYIKILGPNDTPKIQKHFKIKPGSDVGIDEAKKKKKKEDPNQMGLPFGGPLHDPGEMPPESGGDDQHEVFTAYDTGNGIWQRMLEVGAQEKELEIYEGLITNVLYFIWQRWKHQLEVGLSSGKIQKGTPPPEPTQAAPEAAEGFPGIKGIESPPGIHEKFLNRGFIYDTSLKGYYKAHQDPPGALWSLVKWDGNTYFVSYPHKTDTSIIHKEFTSNDPYYVMNTIQKVENAEFGNIVQSEEDALKVKDAKYFNAPNGWTPYNPYSPKKHPGNIKPEAWIDKELGGYGFEWMPDGAMYYWKDTDGKIGTHWQAIRFDKNGTIVYFYHDKKGEPRYFCSKDFNEVQHKIEVHAITTASSSPTPITHPQYPLDPKNYPTAPDWDKNTSSQGNAIKLNDADHKAILGVGFKFHMPENIYKNAKTKDQFKLFSNGFAWYNMPGIGEGVDNNLGHFFDMLKSKYGQLEWGFHPMTGHEVIQVKDKFDKMGYTAVEHPEAADDLYFERQPYGKVSSIYLKEVVVVFPNHSMNFYLYDVTSKDRLLGVHEFESLTFGIHTLTDYHVDSIKLHLAADLEKELVSQGFSYVHEKGRYEHPLGTGGLKISITFFGDGQADADLWEPDSSTSDGFEEVKEKTFVSFYDAILWAAHKNFEAVPPSAKTGPTIKGKIQGKVQAPTMPFSGFDYEGWAKETGDNPKATIKLVPEDDKTMQKMGWGVLQTEDDVYYYINGKTGDMAYFYVDGHAQILPKGQTPITLPKVKMAMAMLWAQYYEDKNAGLPPTPEITQEENDVTAELFHLGFNLVAGSGPIGGGEFVFEKNKANKILNASVIWNLEKKTLEYQLFHHGKIMKHWTKPVDEGLKELAHEFAGSKKSKKKKVLAGTENMPWSGTDYVKWGKSVEAAVGKGKGMNLHPTEEATLKKLGWEPHNVVTLGRCYSNGNETIVFYPNNKVEYWSKPTGDPTQSWDEVEMPIRWLWKNKGSVQKTQTQGPMPYSGTNYGKQSKQKNIPETSTIRLDEEDEEVLSQMGFKIKITTVAPSGEDGYTYRRGDEQLMFYGDGSARYWKDWKINLYEEFATVKDCMEVLWQYWNHAQEEQPSAKPKSTGEMPYSGTNYGTWYKQYWPDIPPNAAISLKPEDEAVMNQMGFVKKVNVDDNADPAFKFMYKNKGGVDRAFFFASGKAAYWKDHEDGPHYYNTAKDLMKFLWDKYMPFIEEGTIKDLVMLLTSPSRGRLVR